MPKPRIVVIGVAGPSGSGKSTVASTLAACLRSPFLPIPQDLWLVRERMPEIPDKAEWGRNFEKPDGIDVSGFLATVTRLAQTAVAACEEGAATWSAALESISRVDTPKQAGVSLMSPFATSGSVDCPQHLLPPPAATETLFIVLEGFLLFFWPEIVQRCDVRLFVATPQEVCRSRRRARQTLREPAAFDARFDGLVWAHYERYLPTQLGNMGRGATLNGAAAQAVVAQQALDSVDSLLLASTATDGAADGTIILPKAAFLADLSVAAPTRVPLPDMSSAFHNKL